MTSALLGPPRTTELRPQRVIAAQLVRFGSVGGTATVVQLALYSVLSADVGSQLANLISWLVSTLLATEGHRRYTFGSHRRSAESDHAAGLATSAVGLVLSALVLAALGNPAGVAGAVAVVSVSGGVGLVRFGALRWWMVGSR